MLLLSWWRHNAELLVYAQVIIVFKLFDNLAILQVTKHASLHDQLFARGWNRKRWRYARELYVHGIPNRHGVTLANGLLPIKPDVGVGLTSLEDSLLVRLQPHEIGEGIYVMD
jgi:hypothetical protein